MSHCKSAAIWDSFGHKGAFFLGELHYTDSKLGLLSVIISIRNEWQNFPWGTGTGYYKHRTKIYKKYTSLLLLKGFVVHVRDYVY